MGASGQSWLTTDRDLFSMDEITPLYGKMMDMGYDVYLANNTGVEYCQEDQVLDDTRCTVKDPCFW